MTRVAVVFSLVFSLAPVVCADSTSGASSASSAGTVAALPFGADVEFNMNVYEARLKTGSIQLEEAQQFCEAMVALCDNASLPLADRPLLKAHVLTLHGKFLARQPGQDAAAIREFERALAVLSAPLEEGRRGRARMKKIYCEAIEQIVDVLSRSHGDELISWTEGFLNSPLYSTGPFFRDGIAIAKLARA
ncbi:MAG: hypothetical protein JSV80_00270, partial [Acidobacteriota bacterium]